MAKVDPFSILYSKKISPLDFQWDTMVAPPLLSLLTPQDIYSLNQIAMSNKLAAKPEEKYKMIANILNPRGFKKIASGTNRVVYKYLEDQRYCIKVAFDRVGLKDNPMEFQNQFKLKPFVTRIFEVSPCGTVALVERVEPITSREEYLHIVDDIFNLLVTKIIGKYVVDDIGTNFFQNLGIRRLWGVVLLDFPYVYELDGSKMYCNWQNPYTNEYCLGEIDYDDGFNYLVCSKCGKRYQARQLAKQVEKRAIVVEKKGVTRAMEIVLMRGDNVERVITTENESKTTAVKKESIMPGVKVLNKNNFNKRKVNAEKNEENRKKAVEEARDRNAKRVSNNIDKALDNLDKDSFDEEDHKAVEVDAAKAAAKINADYINTGRYPRANTESKDINHEAAVVKEPKQVEQIQADDENKNNESISAAEYIQKVRSKAEEEVPEEDDEEEYVTEIIDIDEEDPVEENIQSESVVEAKVDSINKEARERMNAANDISNHATKEELEASTWENPVGVTDIIIDMEDDTSVMY